MLRRIMEGIAPIVLRLRRLGIMSLTTPAIVAGTLDGSHLARRPLVRLSVG